MNNRRSTHLTGGQRENNSAALRRRCEQIAVDLSAYVDGELEGDEFTRPRCRVEAHLEVCPDCRSLANDWGSVVEVLSVPQVPDRPWFAAEFRRRLEAEEQERRQAFSWKSAGWLGVRLIPVAVTVLGLALGVWVRFELDRDRVSETLVERILRIQDLEASTLASTPVIAQSDRRGDGFDFDDLLISSGNAEGSTEDVAATERDTVDSSALSRPEKDR